MTDVELIEEGLGEQHDIETARRRRREEDKAMELDMDELADLLDGRRPLEDRVAHMRELAERQAASHAELMADEVRTEHPHDDSDEAVPGQRRRQRAYVARQWEATCILVVRALYEADPAAHAKREERRRRAAAQPHRSKAYWLRKPRRR